MSKKSKKVIKHTVYFILYYSGLLAFALFLIKHLRRNHRTLILFYHRFGQGSEQGRILPSLNIDEFNKQLIYLRRWYSFISMDEVAKTLGKGESFERPSIAITIDDGYRDNYTLAFPILHKLNIPATIYLTSGLIGTEGNLWVDDIEFALTNARVDSFCFPDVAGEERIEITTLEGKKIAEKHIFSELLKKNNFERKKLMGMIFDVLGVETGHSNGRARVMLDWGEISEMAANGISFGAHTLTHPFLPAMALDEAKHEIAGSRELIERRIKRPVKHFAIPNGRRDDFTEELRSFCDEIGFDTVVTTESGIVDSSADRFVLKRALPPGPLYYFACEVARYLFL